ncbi:CotH kinase family protein [Flavobacterium antarcticum]|uniref:CotH kinase family protein n=1 Tax=Flavobacterium antarcticum TaxID=271155 RepID=UPI0003B3D35C|nr:CotH kinase family protein [Flavobacterium antarcticum]
MRKIYSSKLNFLAILLFFNLSIFSQNIAINEVMSSNNTTILDEDDSPSDWIELYNYGTESINLEGFGLTDDAAFPFKWTFPNVVLNPNTYLLVWASDKNRKIIGQPLHTNFKIGSGGEEIRLTNLNEVLVSQSPSVALPSDVSYGRQPDGTGLWYYFYESTPNATNGGLGLTDLLVPPLFSQDSGFFTEAFDLTLSHPNPNATIIYTLDGSDPDINNLSGTTFQYKNVYQTEIGDLPGPFLSEIYKSFQYSSPINIVDKSAQPDKLGTKNTRQHTIYVPLVPLRKAMILKAKSYVNGIPSKTISKTYFVWSNGNPYNLPVVSLQTQENNLFDYNLGTYTAGVDFDTWRLENPTNNQYYRPEWCNYARKSSTWEYPMNVQIFNNSNSVLSQNAGYRIHGNNSRTYLVKSMRLYADTDYDENDYFQHNLFTIPIFDAPNATNNKYKRILLRPNGSGGAVTYDVVFNRIMQPFYNGVTRIQPVIQFLNGEFWGLSTIRDRFDKYHYAYNFNLNKDNIVQVSCGGNNCELDEGLSEDYSDYNNLRNYIIANDMANETFYAIAANQLDITSFIDHMVLQIYSGTNGYEHKFWKAKVPENNDYGDGKWRTTIQDFEPALTSGTDWLQHWGTISGSPNEALFANLLANENFKKQFINRFADMLNSAFTTSNFLSVVNKTYEEVTPYLAENFNRTPATNFYTASNKTKLINWGTNQPTVQRNAINTFFNIANTVDIVLSLSSSDAGIIKMNTIDITATTPGITQNPYPWTGTYFKGIPVKLAAKAAPGFIFSHWSGDYSGTDSEIVFSPETNKQIQANFVPDVSNVAVTYFWFMDGSIPNNVPLSNLNSTYSANSLTASLLFDSCLSGYPFTSTHPNWRKASMERKNSPTAVNYFPTANDNLPYDSDAMKGIQIKQPFKFGTLENAIRLVFPTTDLEQIKISFAVENSGAASSLLFDYWSGSDWITTGIANPIAQITQEYQAIAIDLSSILEVNNQAQFQFRIRFDGDNMFLSEGNKVNFNNFAIEAQETLKIANPETNIKFTAYPNPVQTTLHIASNTELLSAELYNLYGQMVRKIQPNTTLTEIDVRGLPNGIYILKVKNTSQEEKAIKIIKN